MKILFVGDVVRQAGCPAGRGRGLRGLAEEGAGTCRDKRLDF